MNYLYVDFETRSTVDLRKTGSSVYAKDPSTDIICVGFAVNDGSVHIVTPSLFKWELPNFYNHIVVSHNAKFEMDIWNNVGVSKYGFHELLWEKVDCTMVRALAMGLPGSLEEASAAAGITEGKDQEGHRVMMQLCKPKGYLPNGDPIWWDEEEHVDKYERLGEYCRKDVEIERELHKRLRPLSDFEREVWELDQRINSRGIKIDVEAVTNALEIVEKEKLRLNDEMERVTMGWVSTCTAHHQLQVWINMELTKQCPHLEGKGLTSVDAATLAELNTIEWIPKNIKKAIALRKEAAKSSTAKLRKMLECVDRDGRIRNTMQYYGAGTGRWAGRQIQPHNFPRGFLKEHELEEVFDALR